MFTLYKKIIKQVSNDCNICIMRQEKGGLIVIDILKYRGNIFRITPNKPVFKTEPRSNKTFENKIQKEN